jgi:LemA protein
VRSLRVRATRRFVAGTALSILALTLLLRAFSESTAAAVSTKSLTAGEFLRLWTPYLQRALFYAAPLLAVLGVIVYSIVIYNGLVALRNEVDRAWSNIDVLLKQRFDLVPNLVEVCKGYMHHEQSTLEGVTLARRSWSEALRREDKLKAAQESSAALQHVLLSAENYPSLRANENFMQLQQTLTELEQQIADRREFYNASVGAFNTRIRQIPDAWVAGLFGYAARPFWEMPGAAAQPDVMAARR